MSSNNIHLSESQRNSTSHTHTQHTHTHIYIYIYIYKSTYDDVISALDDFKEAMLKIKPHLFSFEERISVGI